jgi:hypothetical protein
MSDYSKLIDAHKIMMNRYRNFIIWSKFTDEKFLLNFCDTAQTLTNPDKLSRWVGYIQGVLIERKVIDTDTEREYSRTIYKPIYDELGFNSTTVDVGKNDEITNS